MAFLTTKCSLEKVCSQEMLKTDPNPEGKDILRPHKTELVLRAAAALQISGKVLVANI